LDEGPLDEPGIPVEPFERRLQRPRPAGVGPVEPQAVADRSRTDHETLEPVGRTEQALAGAVADQPNVVDPPGDGSLGVVHDRAEKLTHSSDPALRAAHRAPGIRSMILVAQRSDVIVSSSSRDTARSMAGPIFVTTPNPMRGGPARPESRHRIDSIHRPVRP